MTVSGDAAYAACFKRNSYGVSLSSNVEGVGELSGEGVYEFGQVVHVQARQTDDRRFVGWQLVGADGSKTHFADDADAWFVLDEGLMREAAGTTCWALKGAVRRPVRGGGQGHPRW